jgi:hypothetical protein
LAEEISLKNHELKHRLMRCSGQKKGQKRQKGNRKRPESANRGIMINQNQAGQ